MRLIFMLCCVIGFSFADNIFNTLENMKFDAKTKESLKVAMVDFYAESRAYSRNSHIVRDKMLLALQNGNTDTTAYEEAFKELSEQFICAEIAFYHAVVETIGSERTGHLIEHLRNN